MTNIEKIKAKLDSANCKYELLPELGKDLTIEAQVHAKGIKFSEGMSTLIYKAEGDKFLVFLRRDDRLVDLAKLSQVAGVKRIQFAKEEDINKLGFYRGLVSPVIIPDDIPIYVDNQVNEMSEITCGAASEDFYLQINKDDLLKVIGKYSFIDATLPNPKRQSAERTINRVLSGITPSGKGFHIGNYFGAVKEHIEMQNKISETFYFIANLHALTTVKDAEKLKENTLSIVLDYLALGLDPEKSVFYRQSDIPEISQLAVVLGNYISYGQMKRMHAFKDKLQKGTSVDSVNMGLFNYPILMAADILLFKPDAIPVGEDQRQHVELARDIAENFNHTYGKNVFVVPEPLIKESKISRVVGTDGVRKMSKSIGNTIEIFASDETIKKQIMGCYTDPKRLKATDPGNVDGNPVFLYHDLINDNKEEVLDLKERYTQGKVGDVEVKEKLIIAHKRFFGEAQERRKKLEENLDEVKNIMTEGARKAHLVAEKTIEVVYETIGIQF